MNIWTTTVLVVFFQFAILVKCQEVTSMVEEDDTFHDILGKAIYVPKEDLLGSIPNGITFFSEIDKECQRNIPLAITSKDQSFYKNTAEFYKSIATETNLKASYESAFTLGFTLDVTTKHVSGNKREVSGTSLNLATKKYELQMSPNCLYESSLESRVLSDFSELRKTISSPWHESSWRDYQRFLETHGSHVITGVTYGSSVDQYAFAEAKSAYTARDFTVKACLSLGVPAGPGKVGLSACSGVTKEDKESSSNKKMTTTITVKGGTPSTRSKLIYQRTDDLIIQFLEEGNTDPTPIEFELTPIFKILQQHSATRELSANVRCENLRHYFDGYLTFGCPYREAKRGPALQLFNLAEHSSPENPVYQCTLAPQGCHHDWDCHYHIGVWCNCEGDSCIRYGESKNSAGETRATADAYYGEHWGWHGCDWKLWGSQCACRKENKNRLIIY